MLNLVLALLAILLLAIIMIIGFNITLGEFMKSKLFKTIACWTIIFIGIFFFAIGINGIIIAGKVPMNMGVVIPNAIVGGAGGIVAGVTGVIWWYKVKGIKEKKKTKKR